MNFAYIKLLNLSTQQRWRSKYKAKFLNTHNFKNWNLSTQQRWDEFCIYIALKSPSAVANPCALTRWWELQLALNSPMAVATPLYLKKLKKHASWKQTSWKENLQKQNRQFDWRFTYPCPDSPAEVASSSSYQIAITSGVFLATWEMLSKLAIGNGGLLRAPCILRKQTTPSRKFFQNHPIWGNTF